MQSVRSALDPIDQAFRHLPPQGSPYQIYCTAVPLEKGPSGEWGQTAPTTSLKHHAMSLSLFAVDCLACSAHLVGGGNYLFGFYPVVRSSLEASVAMLTAFDDQISHRSRALRHMMLVRQAAHSGRRNSTDPSQVQAFDAEVSKFDSMLELIVGADQIKKNKKWDELEKVEGEALPPIRSQFDRFGEEIGVENHSAIYGKLSDLTHPNSRRIEGVYLGLEHEDVLEAVLSAFHIQLGCLLVSIDRMAIFFGIRDEIDPGIQQIANLGDAIRETRIERERNT